MTNDNIESTAIKELSFNASVCSSTWNLACTDDVFNIVSHPGTIERNIMEGLDLNISCLRIMMSRVHSLHHCTTGAMQHKSKQAVDKSEEEHDTSINKLVYVIF